MLRDVGSSAKSRTLKPGVVRVELRLADAAGLDRRVGAHPRRTRRHLEAERETGGGRLDVGRRAGDVELDAGLARMEARVRSSRSSGCRRSSSRGQSLAPADSARRSLSKGHSAPPGSLSFHLTTAFTGCTANRCPTVVDHSRRRPVEEVRNGLPGADDLDDRQRERRIGQADLVRRQRRQHFGTDHPPLEVDEVPAAVGRRQVGDEGVRPRPASRARSCRRSPDRRRSRRRRSASRPGSPTPRCPARSRAKAAAAAADRPGDRSRRRR